jgi:hypothetical protein
MKTEAATEKIGWGNSTGASTGGISTFSNVFLIRSSQYKKNLLHPMAELKIGFQNLLCG